MTELSPAAQTVLDAYDNSPFDEDCGDRVAIAAALEAVADQVVPEQLKEPHGTGFRWGGWAAEQEVRSKLLTIAAELRGTTTTGDTMTNTNPRDLIQQLAGLARRKHYTCEDSWYSCPQSEGGSDRNPGAECDCGADEHNAKVDAIWAALSLPEPEGPTVMEIIELADEIEAEDLGQVDLVRRALARCGRPAVEPVPVSKRLPGEEDCDPSFQCWWFTPSEEKWILWPIKWAGPECSHWLPHYALPVPTTETP